MKPQTFFLCSLVALVAVAVTVVRSDDYDDSDRKNTKINTLFRYIKQRSARTVNEVDNPELNGADLSHLSEQELLDEICSRMKYTRICKRSVSTLNRINPEKLNEIVAALRSKSDTEDARKLLRHKLIEYGVDKAEEAGLDYAMNTLVDLLMMRNPYGLAANKMINVVSKYI